MLRNIARVAAQSSRQFSRTAANNEQFVPEGYKKLKVVQAKFQQPDGLPVHLKGGMTDRVLYGATVGLCALSLGIIVKLIFDLSVPKKE